MIVAVSSVKDEADIIHDTLNHLFDQNVDHIVISDGGSEDGTPFLIELTNTTVLDQTGPFDQGAEITRLSLLALEAGATWVIPFDADEFWIGTDGRTVKAVLDSVPDSVGKVYAATYAHTDWDYRQAQKPLSKVCFRPTPDLRVHWGNHGVDGVPGEDLHGILEVRELQYRSWEHFQSKVEKARALFASWDVPYEHGSHMRRLTELTPDQLLEEWNQWKAQPTTFSPIPRSSTRP